VPTTSKLFLNFLTRLKSGHLQLITPEGSQFEFGDLLQPLNATLKINDWRACKRIFHAGDIGFAESVEAGWIEISDITALLRLAIRNEAALNRLFNGSKLVTFLYRLRHWLRPNTRKGSRRNIHAHYDIGNEFYQLWLDKSMTYSSALFEGDFGLSLQSAQERKYQRIIDQLGLSSGHHVLEIGCGWGGFAKYAGLQGIKVTGITISPSQLELAQDKINQSGLQDFVNLHLLDYRDVEGEYDAVVSIEMFEAVGERFWPDYFKTVAARLKSGGSALIQSITITERDFERYRSGTDFIQQYIFPGGMLPSPERFCSYANASGLQTQQQFAFGGDYAETLRRWREAWEGKYESILKQGFDERFMRIWRLYFAYCEAGFAEGKTDVMQFLLKKD
jgi:cyclopropane-fatty-acyl-phospholipid synthase